MEYAIAFVLALMAYGIGYSTGCGSERRRIKQGRLEFSEALKEKRDETVIHW